jgi:hypothetical protein
MDHAGTAQTGAAAKFCAVSFNPSRITHSNGVSGGASVVAGWPFTTKFVDIDSSYGPATGRRPWQAYPIMLPALVNGNAVCAHLRCGLSSHAFLVTGERSILDGLVAVC